MITIELNNLEFYAYHGVYEEEREKGNTFIVNLAVTGKFEEAVAEDELGSTIDYEGLYAIVKTQMEVPSKLLEHVVGRIRKEVKKQFPEINSIDVAVEKLNPPIGGKLKSTRVRLTEKY